MADFRKSFIEELAKNMPRFGAAFNRVVQDLRVTLGEAPLYDMIGRALETGDASSAADQIISALDLSEEFFDPLSYAISETYRAGAEYQIASLPKGSVPGVGRVVVRFSGRSPDALAWTSKRSADLITAVSDDVRQSIRRVMEDAVENNRRQRDVAKSLIGSNANGKLTGGLIGLTKGQTDAVLSARRELEQSDIGYFNRERRDKRFDGTIRKAMLQGRKLNPAYIDNVVGRYSDRLLRLRAATIARTESSMALEAGRAGAVAKMVNDGQIPANAVSIIWDATTGSLRTRDSHRALSGMSVKWGEKFVSPVTGHAIRWPHDDEAHASERINCRCSCRFRIDWALVADWREEQQAA